MGLNKISEFFDNTGATLKSIVKIVAQSSRCTVGRVSAKESERPFIVMGNGPSLRQTIDNHLDILQHSPTMAVNFAANTDEYTQLKPKYYILADPHFFGNDDPNVKRLWERINSLTDWEMTLLVPAHEAKKVRIENPRVKIERYNPIGVEGFKWIENLAYSNGRGMPRPRNVLIPAIMMAIRLGYKNIYIVGADHSWMRTLEVNDRNEVVSVQPHFYRESESETKRVTAVYADIPLHSIIMSFYVAFRAYHRIEDYARRHGINIYNSTPDSFIDAFRRRKIASK